MNVPSSDNEPVGLDAPAGNSGRCASWRERRLAQGWVHIQFWSGPEVASQLRILVNEAREVDPNITMKEVIEDLILTTELTRRP